MAASTRTSVDTSKMYLNAMFSLYLIYAAQANEKCVDCRIDDQQSKIKSIGPHRNAVRNVRPNQIICYVVWKAVNLFLLHLPLRANTLVFIITYYSIEEVLPLSRIQ